MSKPLLKLSDVADMLQVPAVTVRLWTDKGLLKAERTPGGHRRYHPESVKQFAAEHGMSLPGIDKKLSQRVLIVDDDANWRTMVVELLSKAKPGLEIETAEDGFSAGQKVRAFIPGTVLLDVRMPGISGIEVCQAIKRDPETATTRIVAISGYASEEDQHALLEAGAERCLQKPVDVADLVALFPE